MANQATLAFADAIKSANRNLDRMRKYKANLIAHRKELGKVTRMLAKGMKQNDHMYLSNWDSRPYIGVALYDLESFKCLELETMLAALMNLGEIDDTKDWPSALNRDYKFKLESFDVTVSAYVRDDSPTCRRVVVGTEIKQVETYKIVCD